MQIINLTPTTFCDVLYSYTSLPWVFVNGMYRTGDSELDMTPEEAIELVQEYSK